MTEVGSGLTEGELLDVAEDAGVRVVKSQKGGVIQKLPRVQIGCAAHHINDKAVGLADGFMAIKLQDIQLMG